MVILTFIRHGETDFNKYGILQGHLNVQLNSKGRLQAQQAGVRLNGTLSNSPIDLVISSDLDRAHETASIIVDNLSIKPSKPIITTSLLRERYLGKLEGVDIRQLVNWEELPEPKKQIDLQNFLSQKSNLSSILNNNSNNLSSPSSPSPNNNNNNNNNNETSTTSQPEQPLLGTPISYYNALKHLPQKELKIESKQKLIKRSKEAFQFIMKQIPQRFVSDDLNIVNHFNSQLNIIDHNASNGEPSSTSPPLSQSDSSSSSSTSSLSSSTSSTSSSSSTIFNNENIDNINTMNNESNDFINNCSTDMATINNNFYSSGTSSKPTESSSSSSSSSFKDYHILIVSHSLTLKTILSLLLFKRPTTTPFCNHIPNESITQSEESSTQHFKWIQLELKNASLVRTIFAVIEKRDKVKDQKKRIPREVVFYPVISIVDSPSTSNLSPPPLSPSSPRHISTSPLPSCTVHHSNSI